MLLPIGVWSGRDLLGFDAGDPNLSRYVRNNPTNTTDPSGLDVYVFWIEGARFDIGKEESPTRVLYNEIIKPLMEKYKKSEKIHWEETETGWGRLAEQKARKIEENVRKQCENKDKVVLIGYSWGGWILVRSLEMSYYKKRGGLGGAFRQQPFTVDLVYTIDPVAGNPGLDSNKTTFGHKGKDKTGKEVSFVYGQFKDWHNWYQQVDKKTLLDKSPIWGREIPDPRVTNKEYGRADFTNPDFAHIEIVSKREIKDSIDSGINKLLKDQ